MVDQHEVTLPSKCEGLTNCMSHQSSLCSIIFPDDFNSFPSTNRTNDLRIMREKQSMRVIVLQKLLEEKVKRE